MQKLVGERGIMGYLHKKPLINFKGKQSHSAVEKAGKYYLVQVIKANVSSDGTN